MLVTTYIVYVTIYVSPIFKGNINYYDQYQPLKYWASY